MVIFTPVDRWWHQKWRNFLKYLVHNSSETALSSSLSAWSDVFSHHLVGYHLILGPFSSPVSYVA